MYAQGKFSFETFIQLESMIICGVHRQGFPHILSHFFFGGGEGEK